MYYVIGDIHGCYDEFKLLYESMISDFKELNVTTKPKIVILGDMIDRGPKSKDVVRFIINKMNNDIFEWIVLKGNHEDMMVNEFDMWMYNGGRETINSYINSAPDLMSSNIGYNDARNVIPSEHYNFLKKLPSYYITGKVIFVHAGIHPTKKISEQHDNVFLWGRDMNITIPSITGLTVIHGHTPIENAPRIFTNPLNKNEIISVNLDGGCCFGKSLVGIRIDDVNKPSVSKQFKIENLTL